MTTTNEDFLIRLWVRSLLGSGDAMSEANIKTLVDELDPSDLHPLLQALCTRIEREKDCRIVWALITRAGLAHPASRDGIIEYVLDDLRRRLER